MFLLVDFNDCISTVALNAKGEMRKQNINLA